MSMMLRRRMMERGATIPVYATVTGNPAMFSTVRSAPLQSLVAAINLVQTGSGDPSPSNARLITGHSTVNIYVSDTYDIAAATVYPVAVTTSCKNLFDGCFLQGYWAYANGAFTAASAWICTPKIPCIPSTTYVASWGNGYQTRWQGFVWYDSNGDFISTTNVQANATTGISATSPANAAYFGYNIAATTSSGNIYSYSVTEFQVETGAVASAYEPRIAEVYGGVVDVISGELTVDSIIRTFTGADGEAWGVNSSGGIWAFNIPNFYENKISQTPVSNMFVGTTPKAYGNLSNGQCAFTTSPHNYINFKTDAASTVAAWRAFLASHNLQVVLKISTPIVAQLNPQQINALLGVNNIWADTGDVTVTYQSN